ncbi:MAG: ferric reductase-like transmembrane domain-containing protein [Actinomycetes bacterium]
MTRYRRQAGRRRLASDALTLAGWAVLVAPIGLWLSAGGWEIMASSGAEATRGVGILAGLLATSSMVVMLWLAARVPLIDRTIGHDRALALHSDLGQMTFLGLLLHGLFVVSGYALGDGLSWAADFGTLWGTADFALAVASSGLLAAVALSSVALARRRLPHEAWLAVHWLSYAAVLLALPHQFSLGGLFLEGAAFWFWAVLWAATVFVLLTFRVFGPLATSLEHRLVVSRVVQETADSVTIELTGRHLERLGARGGQFFNWRFLTRHTWWHQHPFSLSAAPSGDTLRITVRELGAGTRRLARGVRAGTRVLIEGPYGRFSDAARTAPAVVMVGFGIGVAPLRALLETTDFVPDDATVILRARGIEDLPLLSEVAALCQARGAHLMVLTGRRGVRPDGTTSWLPQSHAELTLGDLVGRLERADVFVCGPNAAIEGVLTDARAAGAGDEQLHRERFAW